MTGLVWVLLRGVLELRLGGVAELGVTFTVLRKDGLTDPAAGKLGMKPAFKLVGAVCIRLRKEKKVAAIRQVGGKIAAADVAADPVRRWVAELGHQSRR